MLLADTQLRGLSLLIVSHVDHYEWNGELSAYGPYAREIDIWADLFSEIVIASPLLHAQPPRDCLPFSRSNIRMAPQRRSGGDRFTAKAMQIVRLPSLIVRLARTMRGRDAIHVRCPGNLGLLGVILAPLFGVPVVAKYAGQWNGYRGEPLSVKLQRWILGSPWWRKGVVTVYGEWPGQPRQVVPFFTSMMTEQQVRTAAVAADSKTLTSPLQILYAGRLVAAKCVGTLIDAAAELKRQRLGFELHIVGDGEERSSLEQRAQAAGLGGSVHFHGAVSFSEAMRWHARANLLVLPSEHSEGWPKVLAEAMCHGVVCIGTDHGLLPWMLAGRGRVFHAGCADSLAAEILTVAGDEALYRRLSRESARWAQQYSIEKLRDALAELLADRWGAQPAKEPAVAR